MGGETALFRKGEHPLKSTQGSTKAEGGQTEGKNKWQGKEKAAMPVDSQSRPVLLIHPHTKPGNIQFDLPVLKSILHHHNYCPLKTLP